MKLFFHHFSEGFAIAYRALKANPGRSILTTLGIIIGVLTVILMITIVQGLNQSFKSQLSFIGSGVLYINRQPWINMENYDRYRNRPWIKVEEYKAVLKHSTLASSVALEIATMKTVKYKEKRLNQVEVDGVSTEYVNTLTALPKLGRFLNDLDVAHNRMVTVIGTGVADELFPAENPIGRRVSIGGIKFRVVGVLEKQGNFLGFSLDNRVIIPYGAMSKNFGRKHWVSIIVKARDPGRVDDLEYELKGIMRRERGLRANEEDNFAINQQSMLLNLYKQITSGVYAVGIAIGGISLIVGGIGIMNIMLVSVTERTHEIGIRKAIGAKRGNIIWQFLVESASLCSIGGCIGVGVAFGISKAIDKFLPTSMPIWVALLGIGFAASVGICFGLWPAIKAANLKPIEALRYE